MSSIFCMKMQCLEKLQPPHRELINLPGKWYQNMLITAHIQLLSGSLLRGFDGTLFEWETQGFVSSQWGVSKLPQGLLVGGKLSGCLNLLNDPKHWRLSQIILSYSAQPHTRLLIMAAALDNEWPEIAMSSVSPVWVHSGSNRGLQGRNFGVCKLMGLAPGVALRDVLYLYANWLLCSMTMTLLTRIF